MKIALMALFVGFFLIRDFLEDAVGSIIQPQTQLLLGLALIGVGLWKVNGRKR